MYLTFLTELYFTDIMEEVLWGCFHTSTDIKKSGKTSFTVYSKVLLSSSKRASGKLTTEKN